jgi:anti-repressor protein
MDLILSGENLTMSSVEIAERTGKSHKNIMRDIKKQFDGLKIGGLNYESTYITSQNKELPCYLLDKEQSIILASGYNVELRAKIIKRWMELEEQNQPKVPATMAEALKLAYEQAVLIEEQQATLTEQAPKVEFYDDVTGSSDTVDMGKVAKVLDMGIGRNKLFQFLRDHSILQKNNEPYQNYVDRGYFRVIESRYSKPDGSTHIGLKTVVYQKGLDYIRKLLKKELIK